MCRRSPDEQFFAEALVLLRESRIPFLVGGAYAFERYTMIVRHTRDLDVFVTPEDAPAVLARFENAGYETDLPFPHWLGKVRKDGAVMDVIYSSGNGVARVDERWFAHATESELFGIPIRLCPVEEMIWSKAFIMERERFDGADVIHLIAHFAKRLDWARLLERFRLHPHVLHAHLVLFAYAFPGLAGTVAPRVWKLLQQAVDHDRERAGRYGALCRGTFLSRSQYLVDIERGAEDARLRPTGPIEPDELAVWTEAALREPGTGLPGAPLKAAQPPP